MAVRKLLVNKNRIIKLILAVVLTETWVISMQGCAWNDSILVYVMAAVIMSVILKTDFTGCSSIRCVFGSVLSGISIGGLFYLGATQWGISGNIVLSRVLPKTGLVFLGGCLAFYIAYAARNSVVRNSKRYLAIAGWIPFLVLSFWLQGIASFISVAGWSTGICFFLFWNYTERSECTNREKIGKSILSVLFAAFVVLGNWTLLGIRLDNSFFAVVCCCGFLILNWFGVFYTGLTAFLELVSRLPIIAVEKDRQRSRKGKVCSYFINWGSIFLMWLPYFLCWYPGILSHDSVVQMEQVLGVTAYSNHHPWLHTLLIQACVKFGMLFGDVNSGVAVYSLFSMLLLSGAFAGVLVYIRKKGAACWLRALMWTFFAVFPINAVFSVTMWKDIIFAVAVLGFVLVLDIWISKCLEGEKISFWNWIGIGILSICVCLLRSNGLYAWVFFVPFWLLFSWAKSPAGKEKRYRYFGKTLVTVIIVMVVCLGYKGWILPAFDVTEPDLIESLSIPTQQIGCVLANDGDVTEEEIALLNNIVDTEQVKTYYLGYISDPIKYLVRKMEKQDYLSENSKSYLDCYLRIGLRNPYLFIKGWVEQTKGYWYHKVNSWIYYPDGVRENGLGVFRQPLLPESVCLGIEKLLEITESMLHKFSSIALSTWILLFGMMLAWNKRSSLLNYVLPLGLFATLMIATPVCAEFRYYYAVFLCVPVLLIITLCEKSR